MSPNQQMAKVAEEKCTLTGPEGKQIELPYSLFEAFEELQSSTGRIEIEVREGGVAGVRTETVPE